MERDCADVRKRRHVLMATLEHRDVVLAAYVVGEEISRRRRFGHPVPRTLTDLATTLNRAVLAEDGQIATAPAESDSRWSAERLAAHLGVSARTVRRNARRYGGTKVGTQWTFPARTEPPGSVTYLRAVAG